MTVDEIIMEYKQAKDPEKQIRIMADQCLCKPSEIRSMLREAGVYQAKVRKPRNQPQPSAPEKAAAQPATQEASAAPEAPEAPEALEPPKLEDLRPIEPEADMPRGVLYLTPEKLFDIRDIKASALDAIAEIYPKEATEDPVPEGAVYDFAERVLGILMLVDNLKEQGGHND